MAMFNNQRVHIYANNAPRYIAIIVTFYRPQKIFQPPNTPHQLLVAKLRRDGLRQLQRVHRKPNPQPLLVVKVGIWDLENLGETMLIVVTLW